MFEQLFTRGAAVAHHRRSPFCDERQLYLKQILAEGRSQSTARGIAQLLLDIAQHLRLDQAEITLDDVEAAATAWSKTTHRSCRCRHVGERLFVHHATCLLRLLGRLQETRAEGGYAARLEEFLQFQRQQRGLSPSTLYHYEMCVGALLNWIAQQGTTLEEATLEDISSYFQTLSQRGLKRTSIALHVAKLRNFFRFASA